MKNKIIFSILILSMLVLVFSGCDIVDTVIPSIPDDEETSDYFRLDVPYIEQNSNNTCLPASGAIILKYYEDPRDIDKIQNKLALPWQEDGTGGIMVSNHGDIDKLFNYVKSLGVNTKKEWGLTIEEIKEKLEDGFPVIVLQDFYKDARFTGHFSVIVGYREIGESDEENKLIINDPWSDRGQYWEVTYSDFKIRNSDWWEKLYNFNSDLAHSYIIWGKVTCPEEEVTLDSFRVAFEDIEWANWSGGNCQGNNDYDYEDCVCDVDVDGKFICGDHLKEVKFTITYQNDGSGNLDHEFGLKMPSVFVGKSCTYNLNGSISSGVPCLGEFIFFHRDTATPGEVFCLTITFESPFAYSNSSFVQSDIHGNLIDIKPFINIYWDNDNSFKEKLLAGTGDKRVLLVPDGWQWPSSDRTPLWDVYAEVIETDCYPEFTNPGTWTWTGGSP